MNYYIKLSNKGFKNKKAYYIGRPSSYANPFPTKISKYSDTIYTLSNSLKKYEEEVLYTIDIKEMISDIKRNGYITLSCFCINMTINKYHDYSDCLCHGELIAKRIFEELNEKK